MGRSDASCAFARLRTFNAPQRHIFAITAYIIIGKDINEYEQENHHHNHPRPRRNGGAGTGAILPNGLGVHHRKRNEWGLDGS